MKRTKLYFRSLHDVCKTYERGYADGVRAGKVVGIQQERNIPKKFNISVTFEDLLIGKPITKTIEVEPPVTMRMKGRVYFAQLFKDLVNESLREYHEQFFRG